jgi:hypothetical protein
MNRSLWPEGVEVHQVDLVRETQNTIDAIAVRYTSTNTMGVMSGLGVSPSTDDPTLLHIANGSGYSPNGELVVVPELPQGQNQRNIPLADASAGAINVVLAVYTEVYGDPQAHEDLGTTLPTSATSSSRIVVLPVAQWNSLPVSDPNLNNNSRDRSVVLAIVTGSGGALSQSNIQSPVAYAPVYYVSQPTTLTGVHVDSVSSNSHAGSGILTYLTGPKTLQWSAPGDTIGLASSPIAVDGTYTLYSNTLIYSITVTVTVLNLPTAPATIANDITISSIYSQNIPRLTGIDDNHRHMLGHGIPSVNNPHGMTLADIGGDIGGVLQRHQVEMHANGILDPTSVGAAQTQLASSILSGSGINDVVLVNQFAADGVAYLNGLRVTALTGSNLVAFDSVPADYIALYGIYLQVNGTLSTQLRCLVSVAEPDPFGGSVQPVNISDYNNVFDTAQDLNITYDGAGNFALVGTSGWTVFPVPRTNADSRNILRLPYPKSATDTTPPVVGSYNYIDVYINPAWSGPATSLPIHIYARPSAETTLLLSYVVSQGIPSTQSVTTVMLGWGPYGYLSEPRALHVVDRRLFGTMAGLDINDATIGKEKIKDLSQEQVFNAIGYIPYNGGANVSQFALRTGAPGAEASVTSHVMYADVAGSGGTAATWPTLADRPTLLSTMSNDTTFTQGATFNGGVELPYAQSLRWGLNQYISGANDGSFNFINTLKLTVPALTRISWGGFNNIGYDNASTFTITNNAQVAGALTVGGYQYMNAYQIRGVADPLLDQDVATKHYVDNHSAGGGNIVVVSGKVGSGANTANPPGVIAYIQWSGPPSENEWTFGWNAAAYYFLSMVCTGAHTDANDGNMVTIKTMAKATDSIRIGTFANSGAWDNYPFYYIATFIKL